MHSASKKLKITVVIPVFNLELYVKDAITSALNQTRPPDEIIVVDDCSTDDSEEAIRAFGDAVRYIKLSRNSGVLPAVISGLEVASGHIISFLDGDDIWEERKLELVENRFVEDASLMIVTHNYICINGEGDRIPYHSDMTYKNMREICQVTAGLPGKQSSMLKNSLLCYKGVWLGSAWSIRRSALNLSDFKNYILGVDFPGYVGLTHQDQPLAAYMVLDSLNAEKRICCIDKNLFRYRLHGNNSSGQTTSFSGARRSARRSLATVIGTCGLVRLHPALIEENRIQRVHLNYARYLDSLYSRGNIVYTLYCLMGSLAIVPSRRRVREIMRVILVVFLGLQCFLRVKGWASLWSSKVA